MSRLAAYTWMPTPACADGPPLPAMVNSPSTKSVGRSGSGIGFQRSWSGVTGPLPKSLWNAGAPAKGASVPCMAAGRMRYSQLRRFSLRGAVNAVPLNCSAYNPWAAFCGEFRPTGTVPGTASVTNVFPNPAWYYIAPPEEQLATDFTDCTDTKAEIWLFALLSVSSVKSVAENVRLQDAAGHLVAFDGFEQRLEVAFAEAFVALALDDLEEDRPERVGGENLQQQALLRLHVGVDQDLVARQPRHVLTVV